jgi:programmed cell death protein 4
LQGFERVFEFVDDLEIDAPGAASTVAAFLARAVVDEVLPPSFLIDPTVVNLGGDVVEMTKRMLSRDHQHSRVEKIWGPGDGRPVDELKEAIDALLQEFLISGDLGEAERCVRELRVPHFHHELVKRAISLVVDKPQEQLQMGLGKTHSKLPDLTMDAPCAPAVLDFFVQAAVEQGLVEPNFSVPVASTAAAAE